MSICCRVYNSLSLTPRALISKAEQAIVMTQNRATKDSVVSSQQLFGKWGPRERERETGQKKERETKTGKSLSILVCPEGPVCIAKCNVLTVLMFFSTKVMCKWCRFVRNT